MKLERWRLLSRPCLPWLVVTAWLGPSAPVVAQFCPGPQPEVEPNGSIAAATSLQSPLALGFGPHMFLPVPGAVGSPGDEDYFRIAAQQGDLLWLLVETGPQQAPGASRDSVLDVYDSAGVLLESDDDDGTAIHGLPPAIVSSEASAIAGLRLPATGDYFIRVRAKPPGAVMGYRLLLGLTRTPSEPETEPNDLPGQGHQPYVNPTVLGTLAWSGDVDYYRADVLDLGSPTIFVDGDASASPFGLDVVVEVEPYGVPLVVNSSGISRRPAEALLSPSLTMARLSGTYTGPDPSPSYRIGVFYQGEACSLPVELMSFEVS